MEEILIELRDLSKQLKELRKMVETRTVPQTELLSIKDVASILSISQLYARRDVLPEINRLVPGAVKRTGSHWKVTSDGLQKYIKLLKN